MHITPMLWFIINTLTFLIDFKHSKEHETIGYVRFVVGPRIHDTRRRISISHVFFYKTDNKPYGQV